MPSDKIFWIQAWATIYAKTIWVHIWTENMGLFYASSEGFLMIYAYKKYMERQF